MTNKTIAKRNSLTARWTKKLSLQMLVAAGLFVGTGMLQSCDKDVLTGQPDWLGNSIYERLQEGITTNDGQHRTFSITLRLIDELGYTETLSKTGSKTLFVTPDDVYMKWLSDHNLTLDQMSLNQKKQLFKSSMINNAYLISLMSNVAGNPPTPGMCMRRETEVNFMDSIPTMTVAEMPVNPLGSPKNDAWAKLVEEGEDIQILKDATSAPMIHFLPEFMQNNSMTDEDLRIISNGESNSIKDAWISGKKVISSEQTCKNGYIYVVDGVIEGSTNMAETLRQLPETKMWSQAIDRFSCPVEYRDANFKGYQLAYFNSSANHTRLNNGTLEDDLNRIGVLRIDPGWNQYSVTTPGMDYHQDAAVMIVPTDDVLTKWFNEGGGKDLKTRYASWENLSVEILTSLLNVNMLESFVGSIPSRFGSVLDNSSQRPLGITKENVVRSIMCCNGVIYLVNEVFAPAKFNSVLYPVEIQGNAAYSVMYRAINGSYGFDAKNDGVVGWDGGYASSYDFSPYLSALDSRFALIVPFNSTPSTNPASTNNCDVFRIVDPCTLGSSKLSVLEFYCSNNKVSARRYNATLNPATNEITVDPSLSAPVSANVVANRLYDLIDNNVIIGNVDGSKDLYKTKTGGFIRAYQKNGQQCFQGGLQIELGQEVVVPDSCIVNKLVDGGNGVTYGVACADVAKDQVICIPQTASKSVYQLLAENVKNSGSKANKFLELLSGSAKMQLKSSLSYTPVGDDNSNMGLFDSYNYTVYVPSDEKVQELIDKGYLPTWTEHEYYKALAEQGDEDAQKMADKIEERINNFIAYHVQDNSVAINAGNIDETYETGILNPATKRFYTLGVKADASNITVKPLVGNACNVVKNTGLYNKMAREIWVEDGGTSDAMIASSSYAMVHQIDGVLLYSADQLTPWNPSNPARKKASARRK